MQPTRNTMLSTPGMPRPLTDVEEARIQWALRDDPPIYPRKVKLALVAEVRTVTPQPWEPRQTRRAA